MGGGALERQVPREYEDAARKLDQLHHNLPPLREQKARGLQGPVLATLRGLPEVRGLVVGRAGGAGWFEPHPPPPPRAGGCRHCRRPPPPPSRWLYDHIGAREGSQ